MPALGIDSSSEVVSVAWSNIQQKQYNHQNLATTTDSAAAVRDASHKYDSVSNNSKSSRHHDKQTHHNCDTDSLNANTDNTCTYINGNASNTRKNISNGFSHTNTTNMNSNNTSYLEPEDSHHRLDSPQSSQKDKNHPSLHKSGVMSEQRELQALSSEQKMSCSTSATTTNTKFSQRHSLPILGAPFSNQRSSVNGTDAVKRPPLLHDNQSMGNRNDKDSCEVPTVPKTVRRRRRAAADGPGKAVVDSIPTPPPSPQSSRCGFTDLTQFQPYSYRGVSESAGAWGELGHHNLLHVTTRDPGQHWFTRYCCYLVHCCRITVDFPYPSVDNKVILQDERIVSALEQVVAETDQKEGQSYAATMAKQIARANDILDNMKAAISTTLIRLTGYVLFKVFSRLLTSVVVHKGQLEAIKEASKKGTPLIFVPLHRSHVDYLFVTWVLFNCQIPAPIVAAGENLNMTVFGALLRGTGGFFIKRRLESNKARKDVLYRSLLQGYMSHMLHAGYNLEFFIEGGRTRTGKPAMPKGGLLSVILDSYLSGMLDDAMIVPVAINYDRLVDGNFIREQLGQSKVPESFWGAVCAICKVLSTNYGQSRIDFGAPFSLKEFVQKSRFRQLAAPVTAAPARVIPAPDNKGHQRSLSSPVSDTQLTMKRLPSNPSPTQDTTSSNLHPAMSNSSLFGTELTDEYRGLVKKLGQHIVFDAERCQAMMSSNLVAWVMSFMYRDGATLHTLTAAVEELRTELQLRVRDVGFTGDAQHVVLHAVRLLGPTLISSDEKESSGGELLYKPVTLLPNVIELNYYANALLPVFALDAIVATSIKSVLECDLGSYVNCDTDITLHLDKVMRCSVRLCELLCHEFVLVAPCGKLSSKLLDVMDRLQMSGLLTECKRYNTSRRQAHDSWLDEDAAAESDDDSDTPVYNTVYTVSPTPDTLRHLDSFVNMLTPLLDAYCATIQSLQFLVGKQILEKDLVTKTQELVKTKLTQGEMKFGECIAADPIKNCLKMLEGELVLESHQQDSNKLIILTRQYDSIDALVPLLDSLNALRP
uniref:Glycerol-3-phosphate acyltransferase 1 n=1 Tax=Hirondellea gigas TaxID=1518452 RepID=A0A6A7G4B3_9CRUS